MLKFDLENFRNIIRDFNDQKNISTWAGIYTIRDYNLLDRSAKVACIIDNVVKMVNDFYPNTISCELHLQAMRLGMYEDLSKSTLNEISHSTKKIYPLLAEKRKTISKINWVNMDLSQDPHTVYLAKIGDILNSYFEAKVEEKLGSKEWDILQSTHLAEMRFSVAHSELNDLVFTQKIKVVERMILQSPPFYCSSFALDIIECFARQTQIKRWAKRITLNKFTLLEHSGRVACLTDVFVQLFKSDLGFSAQEELDVLRYALYHDYPEVLLNDTPSPVKQIYPSLNNLLKEIEEEIMSDLELTTNDLTKLIVKMADINDCRYEAIQEQMLGNKDPEFQIVIDEYSDNFNKQIAKSNAKVSDKMVENFRKVFN